MVSYDELVATLEDAWAAAGLHEHALVEHITPTTLERSFRVELFPEHDELLDDTTMPPWVELTFVWGAVHQLLADGQPLNEEPLDLAPLDLAWTFMVLVKPNQRTRSDAELVQMFQWAVQQAVQRVAPGDGTSDFYIPVEVRRVYHSDDQRRPLLSHIQLVSTNITDLLEQWVPQDGGSVRRAIRREVQIASAILSSLSTMFDNQPSNGRGLYRPVETA